MNEIVYPLYSADDTRQMDAIAIDAYGIDSYLLMTKAASFSLKVMRQCVPNLKRLLILCGAGNNAGDGFVVARLANDQGIKTTVCAMVSGNKLTGDAARAYRDFVDAGGQCVGFSTDLFVNNELVIDALLGTGLSRSVEGDWAQVIDAINQSAKPVLSLDVPSGLDANSGKVLGCAIRAQWTCTFVARKVGLYTGMGPRHCGTIYFDSLDIPDKICRKFTAQAELIDDGLIAEILPPRMADAHKGDHGRVLVVAGGKNMPGAALLCAKAALRAGAGLVKVACHGESASSIAAQCPELMVHSIDNPNDLTTLLKWSDVVAVGPGLGRNLWAENLAHRCIISGKPCVVDADALYVDLKIEHGPMVITPHPGEAARLLHQSKQRSVKNTIQLNRLLSCRQLAQSMKCVTVLKGAGTVVMDDQSLPSLCHRGNPGMATAGSGDVLTGIMAAVWAQQPRAVVMEPWVRLQVAKAAVLIHAQCGDAAALDGMRGLIASDLINQLRGVVNSPCSSEP